MSHDVTIRDVRPEDMDAAVEIAMVSWAPIYGSFRGLIGDELFNGCHPDCFKDKERQVRRACAPGGAGIACVAEIEGRVAGFITAYANEETRVGEIGNNAVHPDFRGRGIGPRMYEHVLARLKEQGMRFAKVMTGGDPAHAPARRAYEKSGFTAHIPFVTYFQEL